MLEDTKDNIFLSRWINGELTPEELDAFKSHPEYHHYQRIVTGIDSLELRAYDVDASLASVKSNKDATSQKKSKVIKLWPLITVAASIAIIIGLFLFNKDTTFSSSYGEQLVVALPDGSEVLLNARSTITFDEKNWDKHRNIQLDGEAFFKVKKGSTFTVETARGTVTVLGTEFTVHSEIQLFEAICYSGKVSVKTESNQTILTAGKAHREIAQASPDSWELDAKEPSWVHKTSSFRSMPLSYVFEELEDQYNIIIDTKSIDTEMIYTGTFPNDNLDIALKTVFTTLGVDYTISEDKKTIVLQN